MKKFLFILCVCFYSIAQLIGQQVYFNRTYTDSIDADFSILKMADGYIMPVNAWWNFTSEKFIITKVDDIGNIIFEKDYGNQNDYYGIYNCLILSDSSLMLGSYYWNRLSNTVDSYFMKA